MTIYFYTAGEEPYGCFSNFSAHGFELDGAYWRTVEHYFQAQKFEDAEYREVIRHAPTPKKAKALGRDRGHPLRSDWESVKEGIMRRAVLRKFETHDDLRAVLLNTGNEELVESSPHDTYWGSGSDGSGLNRLGAVLMDVRDTLRRGQESDA